MGFHDKTIVTVLLCIYLWWSKNYKVSIKNEIASIFLYRNKNWRLVLIPSQFFFASCTYFLHIANIANIANAFVGQCVHFNLNPGKFFLTSLHRGYRTRDRFILLDLGWFQTQNLLFGNVCNRSNLKPLPLNNLDENICKYIFTPDE